METFARMHARLEATRELVATGGILDVRYEDVVREPVANMRRIYAALQLGDFEIVQPVVEKYLAERSGYVPNRHSVDPRFADEIRARWKPYFERYGYSLEDGAVIGDDVPEDGD